MGFALAVLLWQSMESARLACGRVDGRGVVCEGLVGETDMPDAAFRKLDREHTQLVVVDVQEKMLPHIADHELVLEQVERMMRAAVVLEVPVTVSEQYVRGLGGTVGGVLEAAPEAYRGEKMTFSVCDDAKLRERIVSLMRPQVLLVGVETHVCVQQTALDLLSQQMRPYVLADAVGSRRAMDRSVSLERVRTAGAVVTTVESVIFELLRESGTEIFKRILPLVR